LHRTAGKIQTTALRQVGGRPRARVVLTLAAVLGLSGADVGAISVTSDNLERAYGVGNTGIGVLLSVVGMVGALCTIPAGILTDRTCRTRLLATSILAWAAATAVSGAASSYGWILGARVFLGVVNATTGPAVASLTGDFFPAADRGRMYGMILAGDLVGGGIGYVISGEISALASWRLAFWWLVLPSAAVAYAVWRLPEPARGRQDRLAADRDPPQQHDLRPVTTEPVRHLILRTDPAGASIWWVARYVLRVRTNLLIIAVSALGYFFFAGLRTFAIIYVTGHFGLGRVL
jgi:MFS family permease